MLLLTSAVLSVVWLLAIAAKLRPAYARIRARQGKRPF